jgi:hypothetical protein
MKDYKIYHDAADMPNEYRYLRVRLQMEQQRFVNFGFEAGLLQSEGQICSTLQLNRSLLIAVLAEIKILMDNYATKNGKYIEITDQNEVDWKDTEEPDSDLLSALSLQPAESEKESSSSTPSEKKSRLAGLRRFGKNLRTIATEPRRLVWASMDKKGFEDLIKRISDLNSFLITLLDGSQIKRIDEATAASYQEILQLRNDINSLHGLVQALSHGSTPLSRATTLTGDFLSQAVSDENIAEEKKRDYLRRLAELKIQYSQMEQANGKFGSSPATLPGINTQLNLTLFRESDTIGDKAGLNQRTITTYNGKSVWIEWKDYRSKMASRSFISQIETRIRLLTELLCYEKPEGFLAPPCLGYVKVVTEEDETRFGIVFEKSKTIDGTPQLVTLRQLLLRQTGVKPSLSARISLCAMLAESVHSFHAVNWLHKGIRSDNVVFLGADSVPDLSKPLISGFELSRPGILAEMTEKPNFNPEQDIYRHPNAQSRNTDGTYRKAYDLYSLGIILVEIANWKPIEVIVGFEDLAHTKPPVLGELQRRLLGASSSDSTYMEQVGANLGDGYREIVQICLEADEIEKRTYSGESEGSISVRLQRVMDEKILKRLRKMEDALAKD